MSLFKDGKISSTKKSALKTFLLKIVKETDPTESTRIIDEGALLWCCDWKRNETFEKICKNTQIFFVITLCVLLQLMDMLHQPKTRHIEIDLEHSLKQWKLKITTLVHQTNLRFSPTILTKQIS